MASNESHPALVRTILFLLIIPLILLIILGIIATDPNLLKLQGLDHFYIEIISVILSFVVAYYSIMRGYAFNDKFLLFLGLGFHAAGMVDLLHAIFAVLHLGEATFEAYFIPQTWVAGRIVMGAVVMIALLTFVKPSLKKTLEKISIKTVTTYSVILAITAALVTIVSLFQPFPFVTIDFFIKRPYELISVVLFLVALVSFYKYKIFNFNDPFFKALGISIVIDISLSMIISTSSFVFDTAFNIAHMLKIVSFFILIMGLSVSAVRKSKEKDALSKVLETSESKYRNLYENSPTLHITTDINNVVSDCNDTCAKRLGYSKDEIIGSLVFKFILEEYHADLKKAFKLEGTLDLSRKEIWYKTNNNGSFPALVTLNSLYDENGKLIGDTIISRDISDYYKVREANEEKKYAENKAKDMQHLNVLKDEFATMVSHELKTPLSPIMGWCDALQDPDILGTITPEQKKAVQTIYSNAEKLEKLIGDLLDIQKLELGRMVFEKVNFQVDEMMDNIKNSFEHTVKQKQIRLVNSVNEKISLKSDKSRIEEVLTNMIYNAIDFVPKKDGRIELDAKNENGVVVFSVKDNGMGISKEVQESIFKKFYQTDTSLTRKHGGTGLGLSICKGIVEALGGKIWVESEKGIGSNFYFTIPKGGVQN